MNKRIENKKDGLITALDYKRPSVKIAYWLLILFLVLCSVIALFPVLWAFLSGFKELDEYYSVNPALLPKAIDLKKMATIAKQLKLARAFINSMIIFVGYWIGEIIIGGLAGYTISRLKPRGSKFLFTLMLWTMMMPGQVRMVHLFGQGLCQVYFIY